MKFRLFLIDVLARGDERDCTNRTQAWLDTDGPCFPQKAATEGRTHEQERLAAALSIYASWIEAVREQRGFPC